MLIEYLINVSLFLFISHFTVAMVFFNKKSIPQIHKSDHAHLEEDWKTFLHDKLIIGCKLDSTDTRKQENSTLKTFHISK